MKPGEGCFLCKSKDHIAKNCPKKCGRDLKKMCLLCRQWGHTLKNCPNDAKSQEAKICYNCGETGHRLADCSQPLKDGGTSFAECFICKELGHISKNCPSNKVGIYPKGGSCKVCGGVTHLAKDCPAKASVKIAENGRVKLKISTDATPGTQPCEGGKHIVFQSGDDLEDDFVEDGVVGRAARLNLSSDENDEEGQRVDRAEGGVRGVPKFKSITSPKVVKFSS